MPALQLERTAQVTQSLLQRHRRLKAVADMASISVPPLQGTRRTKADWANDRMAYVEHFRGPVAMAVTTIANSVASKPIRAKVKMNPKTETLQDLPQNHVLHQLTENPNERMVEFDLLWYTVGYRLTCGDGYIWKIRNGLKTPVELWPLPATWVWAIPSRDKFIESYFVRGTSSTETVIPSEDIIQVSNLNLDWRGNRRYYGQSTLERDTAAINSGEAMWRRLESEFKNFAPPGLHYQTEEELGADDLQKAMIDILTQHSIAEHTGRPIFSHSGFKVSEFRPTVRDMDYRGGLEFAMDWQLATRGVPKAIVGLVKDYNRANVLGADQIYCEKTVQPLQIHLFQQLTVHLGHEFDKRIVLTQDLCKPNDIEQQRKNLETGLRHYVVDEDEYRAFVGLEPRERPLLVPGTVRPRDMVETPPEPATPPPPPEMPESDMDDDDDTEDVERMLSTIEHKLTGIESRQRIADMLGKWYVKQSSIESAMTNAVASYFKSQSDRIVKRLRLLYGKQYKTTGEIIQRNVNPDDANKLLPVGEEDEMLTVLMNRYIAEGMKIGASLEASLVRLELSPETIAHIERVIEETFTTDYWRRIVNDNTRERLKTIFRQSIEDGDSVDDIARTIRKDFIMSRDRAVRIARTESTMSLNGGQFEARKLYMADGIVDGEEWIATYDEATRPEHWAANHQKIKPGEKFDVGGYPARYPGDPSLPAGLRVNCRCTSVPVINLTEHERPT